MRLGVVGIANPSTLNILIRAWTKSSSFVLVRSLSRNLIRLVSVPALSTSPPLYSFPGSVYWIKRARICPLSVGCSICSRFLMRSTRPSDAQCPHHSFHTFEGAPQLAIWFSFDDLGAPGLYSSDSLAYLRSFPAIVFAVFILTLTTFFPRS